MGNEIQWGVKKSLKDLVKDELKIINQPRSTSEFRDLYCRVNNQSIIISTNAWNADTESM